MSYKKCPFCGLSFENFVSQYIGSHIRWCKQNPKNNMQQTKKKFCKVCGKDISDLKRRKRCDECLNKHTEITKQQLALKRLEWLKNNPEKHPWKRKDKFLSKPCELFKKYLDSIKLCYVSEYNMYNETGHNYSIDIAFPDKKIGIEINGNQHYNKDGTLKKYYQTRHDLIEKVGWKLLEIHFISCFDEEKIKHIIKFYKQPDYSQYFKKKKITKLEQKKVLILQRKKERKEKIEIRKNIILNANVDFNKLGWVHKISDLTGLLPQKVNLFMKKYLPEFYEQCFHRKKVKPN